MFLEEGLTIFSIEQKEGAFVVLCDIGKGKSDVVFETAKREDGKLVVWDVSTSE